MVSAQSYVIDVDSGEIVTELQPGDRIIRKQSLEYLQDRDTVSDMGYAKLYLMSADLLSRSPELKAAELKVCLRLLQYVRYDTGLIAYSNGSPINQTAIKEICSDMGERTVEDALSDLVSQGVFSKCKYERQVCYLVNPYIFMRGTHVHKTLIKIFEKSKWAKLHK